jgi:hypothetical protein
VPSKCLDIEEAQRLLDKGASYQTSYTEPTEQPAIAGDLMKETEEECTRSFGLLFSYNIYFS